MPAREIFPARELAPARELEREGTPFTRFASPLKADGTRRVLGAGGPAEMCGVTGERGGPKVEEGCFPILMRELTCRDAREVERAGVALGVGRTDCEDAGRDMLGREFIEVCEFDRERPGTLGAEAERNMKEDGGAASF